MSVRTTRIQLVKRGRMQAETLCIHANSIREVFKSLWGYEDPQLILAKLNQVDEDLHVLRGAMFGLQMLHKETLDRNVIAGAFNED